MDIGNYARAKKLYTDSLNIREQVLGEINPAVAESYHNLGRIKCKEGKSGDYLLITY